MRHGLQESSSVANSAVVVRGRPQQPIEGVSMVYSFDNAKAAGRRTTQYFELATNRAIYHDGWIACSRYGLPWVTGGRGPDFINSPWELYHIDQDFSQANIGAVVQPIQVQSFFVKLAGILVKNMDDKIAVIHQNPFSCVIAFDADRFD